MSSQKGNATRSRSQKHKNAIKFQNDKFDSSKKTKNLNNLQFPLLCGKCEAIIQWKIQYKKYKALTVPAHCIKCEQKTVKLAYHHICSSCAEKLSVCAKCGEYKSIENKEDNEKEEEES